MYQFPVVEIEFSFWHYDFYLIHICTSFCCCSLANEQNKLQVRNWSWSRIVFCSSIYIIASPATIDTYANNMYRSSEYMLELWRTQAFRCMHTDANRVHSFLFCMLLSALFSHALSPSNSLSICLALFLSIFSFILIAAAATVFAATQGSSWMEMIKRYSVEMLHFISQTFLQF